MKICMDEIGLSNINTLKYISSSKYYYVFPDGACWICGTNAYDEDYLISL